MNPNKGVFCIVSQKKNNTFCCVMFCDIEKNPIYN